jgi:hypothetical protein
LAATFGVFVTSQGLSPKGFPWISQMISHQNSMSVIKHGKFPMFIGQRWNSMEKQ